MTRKNALKLLGLFAGATVGERVFAEDKLKSEDKVTSSGVLILKDPASISNFNKKYYKENSTQFSNFQAATGFKLFIAKSQTLTLEYQDTKESVTITMKEIFDALKEEK